MKLIKAGIAKTVPADKVAEYKAAGWVELAPAEKAEPKKKAGKKGA